MAQIIIPSTLLQFCIVASHLSLVKQESFIQESQSPIQDVHSYTTQSELMRTASRKQLNPYKSQN